MWIKKNFFLKKSSKQCRKTLNDKRHVLSCQITYLVLLAAENKDQRHEGHILDIAHWRFSYGLFEQSDRIKPPAHGEKYCSQRRRSKRSGGRSKSQKPIITEM